MLPVKSERGGVKFWGQMGAKWGEIWYGSVPNFTLVGATRRQCGAKTSKSASE